LVQVEVVAQVAILAHRHQTEQVVAEVVVVQTLQRCCLHPSFLQPKWSPSVLVEQVVLVELTQRGHQEQMGHPHHSVRTLLQAVEVVVAEVHQVLSKAQVQVVQQPAHQRAQVVSQQVQATTLTYKLATL
jgi:hypothetical protein